MSFSELAETFHAKEIGIISDKKSNLQFILGFFDHFDDIQIKCGTFKSFMTAERKAAILGKVPENIMFGETTSHDFLELSLKSGDTANRLRISYIKYEINSEILFELFMRNDKSFNQSFKNWKRNPTDQKHVQRVKNELASMKSEYDQCNTHFNKQLRAIVESRAKIETMISSVNESIKYLLNIKETEQSYYYDSIVSKPVKEIAITSMKIYSDQTAFMTKLEKLRDLLKDYNKKRVKWSEFLIGMRETLVSEPKPVELKIGEFTKIIAKTFMCGKEN